MHQDETKKSIFTTKSKEESNKEREKAFKEAFGREKVGALHMIPLSELNLVTTRSLRKEKRHLMPMRV
jgi:hypothetical protein